MHSFLVNDYPLDKLAVLDRAAVLFRYLYVVDVRIHGLAALHSNGLDCAHGNVRKYVLRPGSALARHGSHGQLLEDVDILYRYLFGNALEYLEGPFGSKTEAL